MLKPSPLNGRLFRAPATHCDVRKQKSNCLNHLDIPFSDAASGHDRPSTMFTAGFSITGLIIVASHSGEEMLHVDTVVSTNSVEAAFMPMVKASFLRDRLWDPGGMNVKWTSGNFSPNRSRISLALTESASDTIITL